MRRVRLAARLALALLPLLLLAALGVVPAQARTNERAAGLTLRFPRDLPNLAALRGAMSDPSVTTIVFERGVHRFSETLFVFKRNDLVLCGETGRAGDVVIESSVAPVVLVEGAVRVGFRDLTLRSTAASGDGIRLNGAVSTAIESFVSDVRVAGCRIEAPNPVRATARVENLTVVASRLEVNRANGVGLLWEDGDGLFVTRTRFTAASGVRALAALLVRGAFDVTSEGDRAFHVILSRNRVRGDFIEGFDLADVADVRVRRNVLTFPEPTFLATAPGGSDLEPRARIALIVRRQAASNLTEDYVLRSNRVRNAHTALWLRSAGRGVVAGNDFRRSGSAAPDVTLGDTGSAIRIDLLASACDIEIVRNDLRGLRSPKSEPAVRVTPASGAGACFDGDERNRVDAGRPLLPPSGGITKR